ncbi:hypothetical protein [Streptomyces sp. NPDC059651]|uniref:hypothetical protein n=1 Tax=Streptomyces sp. NPDC059651 TaxID=3346897 RepID=UPI003698B2BE
MPVRGAVTLQRPDHSFMLPANSTVILYADGVGERQDGSLERDELARRDPRLPRRPGRPSPT